MGVARRTSARRKTLRFAGIISAITFVVTASIAYSPVAANATSYPSWSDVVHARKNAAASKKAVGHINNLIKGLTTEVATAQADAAAKGAAAETADEAYYAGEAKQKTLQAQVDAAAVTAENSKKELGQYVSQLARTGGENGGTTLGLLLNGKDAGQLLDSLGTVSQASRQQDEIFKKALSDRNTASELSKLASAQAVILAQQKQAAEAADLAATAAASTLESALANQTAHAAALTLELAALTTKLHLTEKNYTAGVRAAEAAGLGSGVPGEVDSQGWALPTIGVISSPWGFRNDPAAGGEWRMHYGDDIAHGCLQPIYAAHSGTVAYAGPFGDIGNYILIQDGDQFSTAYGHIANGQTFVHIGEQVSAGENIARTGSTGFSTGCHVYFQTFVNNNPVDPVPFMRARGITLGVL